jgi:hypothetical protein
MTEPAPPPGRLSPPEPPRAARLKAALKANMSRRKAQARARALADGNDNNENTRQEGAD